MAKRKKKRIASRGSVNNTILKTLVTSDKYGYEIIKEVEEYSEGKIVLKQPSLYSSLSRFEEKGIVSSYWGDSDIGGRRHYYHLTPLGHKYYKKAVLKITDDEDEELTVEKEEIVDIENKSNNPVEIKPVDLDTIPAIVDFNKNEQNNEEPIIADHKFYVSTPIEQIKDDSTITDTHNFTENTTKEINIESINSLTWQSLANSVKLCNKHCSHTPFKKLHYIKPKKASKVILDTDGIYKLRDADYTPTKPTTSNKIIDNVGRRKEPNMYGYDSFNIKPQPERKELTEEERKLRNENFLNRFNLITKSKMKNSDTDNSNDDNYQNKLSLVADRNEGLIDSKPIDTSPQHQNNLFNYVDEENYYKTNTPITQQSYIEEKTSEEEDDDKFIDFEPIEFETKSDTNNYSEEIADFSKPTLSKISMYESKANKVASESSYVLINKVKFVFGIILSLLLITELSIMLAVFQHFNLIFEGDNIIFISGYIISIIIGLCYVLPYIMNSNLHKINNFRLGFAMLYGFLLFLVTIILIYCVNTLLGFDLTNFKFFAVKIIVPIVLTINLVILPPIYNKLINSSKFYD